MAYVEGKPPVIACATCSHWLKWPQHMQPVGACGEALDPPVVMGFCRRHAPRIQLRGSIQLEPFPTTLHNDVCGDFETPEQFNRRAAR